jgi:hypothetical protein
VSNKISSGMCSFDQTSATATTYLDSVDQNPERVARWWVVASLPPNQRARIPASYHLGSISDLPPAQSQPYALRVDAAISARVYRASHLHHDCGCGSTRSGVLDLISGEDE